MWSFKFGAETIRVSGANGDELTPDSVGVGTPVNQYVAIYRRK